MLEINGFYNMDCMEGMKQFPDKYFELAIVDPPYGININMNMGRRKGKAKKHEDKNWDKGESMYGRSFAELEMAWTSFDASARIYKLCPNDNERIHPTQKPKKLYEWQLNILANKGNKILDTHVGSASSLIACYEMGFDYIGFELDKDYFDKATRRLDAVKSQVRMFGGD